MAVKPSATKEGYNTFPAQSLTWLHYYNNIELCNSRQPAIHQSKKVSEFK